MTRKDYILIAAALNSALKASTNNEQEDGVSMAIAYLTTKLASDNPRFDTNKFIKAVTK